MSPPRDVDLDIERLYLEGVRAHMAEHEAQEAEKVGTFRVGSGGLFLAQDKITGTCHRLAIARYLGIPVPRDEIALAGWELRQLMFELGRANEEMWAAALSASPTFIAGGYKLLREEAIPLSASISHGGKEITVSGRPDLVITDANGRFVKGVELKQVSSLWTARDVMFGGKPKLGYLAQAGNYSRMLTRLAGYPVPYELWFTSRVDFAVSPFFKPEKKDSRGKVTSWKVVHDDAYAGLHAAAKKRQGHPHRFAVELNWRGEVKKITQFLTGYKLRWVGDVLEYQHTHPADGKPKWVRSVVTAEALDDYYRYVSDTAALRDLGTRPVALDPDGSRAGFSPCDYCDVKPLCDEHEGDFEAWLRAMRAAVKSK